MSTVNDTLRKEPDLEVKWFLDKVFLLQYAEIRVVVAVRYGGKAVQVC